MTVTIKDVAEKANVAPSTVSRVIADHPRISEKTKKKVRKIMEELGYYPNFNARSLANQSTKSIGLVMPNSTNKSFQDPFFPEVIRGISSFAHGKDYSICLTTGENEEEQFQDVVKMVQGKRVDGIILLYSRKDDAIVNYLMQMNFPFVIIGRPAENVEKITYIDNNNYQAARELTEYLITSGHKQIAFLGGSERLLVMQDRVAGFCDGMKLADLEVSEQWIKHVEFELTGGKEAAHEIMATDCTPTAIFVTGDLLALGLLSALGEMGIQVPTDVAVVSFNNLMISEISSPPLTTVDVNIHQLGYEAAKCIIGKIEGDSEGAKSIIVPTKIIERQTCREI